MIKVDKKLRAENIKQRGGRQYITSKNSDEVLDEVVKLYNAGENTKDIAKRLGVSRATIYRIIKERS